MVGMKDAVAAVRAAAPGAKVMVGGAPVTDEFAAEIGADGFAKDAATAAVVARELLAGLLRSFGLRVHEAEDGQSALEILQREPADLLITDIDLSACKRSTARRLFLRDRRPELYHVLSEDKP